MITATITKQVKQITPTITQGGKVITATVIKQPRVITATVNRVVIAQSNTTIDGGIIF